MSAMPLSDITEARALWKPVGVYCNTASYGLPPRPAWDALQTALDEWHGGHTSWEHWGQSTEGARAAFARLVSVEVERVAVGSTVSELIGTVVTALPAGARVVVPDIEFTSTLFPLLVQSRLDVRVVPPAGLAEALAVSYGELMRAANYEHTSAPPAETIPGAVKRYSNAHIVELLEQLRGEVRQIHELTAALANTK